MFFNSRSMKLFAVLFCIFISEVCGWSLKQAPLMTRWADLVDPDSVFDEYPRPQMKRGRWKNLNGVWQFQSGSAGETAPVGTDLSGDILVPYPVESAISGVMEHYDRLWYRRNFTVPENWSGKRILLHFEAVDFETEVFINGESLGIHRGGYDPFTYDITGSLNEAEQQELIVRVYDPTDDGAQPRGKQTMYPGGIMYTPSSGIWQSVWLEPVPEVSITSLEMVPDIDNSELNLTLNIAGSPEGITFTARVLDEQNTVQTADGTPGVPVEVTIPDQKLWSPESPFLYDLEIVLKQAGETVDSVSSYFGMRKVSLGEENGFVKMMLNNKFVYQIGPLDQGFWPDGIYTPPTEEAMKFDLLATKKLGFNMIRKHIKVEPRRWYYMADSLGLMVWQDMPSPNSYPSTEVPEVDTEQFETELIRMIETHRNSPAIIMWVIFNEGQGQHNTEGLVNMVKDLDPSRLVNEASGWHRQGFGDVSDAHSYPAPACPLSGTQAVVCGEFGGIGYPVEGHTWTSGWGYQNVDSDEDYINLYKEYFDNLAYYKSYRGMSAAVYTQITDVESELNGILTYDRLFKVDTTRLWEINSSLYLKTLSLTDILPTSQEQGRTWRYTINTPADDWSSSGFNDDSWSEGTGGFGTAGTPGAIIGTTWDSENIWLRQEFNPGALTEEELENPALLVHHDEDCEIYINGVQAASAKGYTNDYTFMAINQAAAGALVPEAVNVLAVHCSQTEGGQYIDAGIVVKQYTNDETGINKEASISLNKTRETVISGLRNGISVRYPARPESYQADILIYNTAGRMMRPDQLHVNNSSERLIFPFNGIARGLYLVKFILRDRQGDILAEYSDNVIMLNH